MNDCQKFDFEIILFEQFHCQNKLNSHYSYVVYCIISNGQTYCMMAFILTMVKKETPKSTLIDHLTLCLT